MKSEDPDESDLNDIQKIETALAGTSSRDNDSEYFIRCKYVVCFIEHNLRFEQDDGNDFLKKFDSFCFLSIFSVDIFR